jgi:hypothetical protein
MTQTVDDIKISFFMSKLSIYFYVTSATMLSLV